MYGHWNMNFKSYFFFLQTFKNVNIILSLQATHNCWPSLTHGSVCWHLSGPPSSQNKQAPRIMLPSHALLFLSAPHLNFLPHSSCILLTLDSPVISWQAPTAQQGSLHPVPSAAPMGIWWKAASGETPLCEHLCLVPQTADCWQLPSRRHHNNFSAVCLLSSAYGPFLCLPSSPIRLSAHCASSFHF